jgi:predicted nucleic acid-binding protein
VTAVDSSVIVAGFASWHESHPVARDILDGEPSVVGHALLEAFSVLTRLPAPHRSPAAVVREFLGARFTAAPLVLDGAEMRDFVLDLDRLRLTGGAVYDALIGRTAVSRGVDLATLDGRARRIYDIVGCNVHLLDSS